MTPKPVSLVQRIGAGVKAFAAGYGSGIATFQPYEGAGFSRKRPIIYGAHARDSRIDLTESTRTELLKLARHMYRNIGLVKGAVDSIAAYSIGPGLRPQYRGSDQEFGKLAEAYWRDVIAPAPEVTGRMTWTDLLMALSRSIDVDGDVFVVMTDSGKLQVVEGHRVCEGDDYGTSDGVFLGKLGEPTAYLVETNDQYRKIPAELVVHLMELERPDQIRGASALARALNHLRDLKLVTEFEKDALKVQSSIAAVIVSGDGDPIANSGGFFGKIQERDSNNDVAREEITSSANIPRLAPGEKIENLSPTRPGTNFENFAKFLIRDIALGLNLPPEFVYDPASVGGAGMRFVVAKAQRRFEQRQRLLIDRFCARAWRYFIARAIAAGDLPKVADYDRVSWQTPKSLTVDAGREAMQAREDYKAGLSTLADYFGELGLDWQEQVDQRKAEEIYVSGGAGTRPDALITKIGAGAASSLLGILQSLAVGQISKDQAVTILVSIYGLTEDDAQKIASQSPAQTPEQAAVLEPVQTPAGPETPEELKAELDHLKKTTALDCGTGAGGFKPGNTCQGGGEGGGGGGSSSTREIGQSPKTYSEEQKKQSRRSRTQVEKIAKQGGVSVSPDGEYEVRQSKNFEDAKNQHETYKKMLNKADRMMIAAERREGADEQAAADYRDYVAKKHNESVAVYNKAAENRGSEISSKLDKLKKDFESAKQDRIKSEGKVKEIQDRLRQIDEEKKSVQKNYESKIQAARDKFKKGIEDIYVPRYGKVPDRVKSKYPNIQFAVGEEPIFEDSVIQDYMDELDLLNQEIDEIAKEIGFSEELAATVTESTAMQAQVEIVPPQTEAFTMKDDPDFTLSEKEADMVAKAIGLKNKPAKKKKA